jgi:hypothetical protein
VNDARVVACLVIGKPGHLVDEEHSTTRESFLKFVKRSRAYDASTYHHHVE